MKYFSGVAGRVSCLAMVLTLTACEPQRLADSSGANSRVASSAIPEQVEDGERRLFELAAAVPSYGGHFIGTDGRVVVWLVDMADAPKVRGLLRQQILRGEIRSGAVLSLQTLSSSKVDSRFANWRCGEIYLSPRHT